VSNSPVIVWNDIAVSFIQGIAETDPDRSLRSTAAAARVYSLLNVAMHEALAGIDPASPLTQRWVTATPSGNVPPELAVCGAIGAGYQVLQNLFSAPAREQQLLQTRRDLVEAVVGPDVSPEATRALDFGKDVAIELMAKFPVPELDPPDDPHLPDGFGQFGFGNGGAQFRRMRPYVMDRSDRFHAAPPRDLTSVEYAREWQEVYAVGSRAVREQAPQSFETRMARLWTGGARTAQESGYWLEIARTVAADPERGLSLVQQAHVMTAVAVALCDAMISSWSSKWTYTFWRPRAAIHQADKDGNPATFKDESWEPLNGSQGGSPEHTSGTASFAGACSTVLTGFFGDAVTFVADFQRVTGRTSPETFHSFALAADVATRSRVYNGIHFAAAGEAGLIAGRAIGRQVIEKLNVTPIGQVIPLPDTIVAQPADESVPA